RQCRRDDDRDCPSDRLRSDRAPQGPPPHADAPPGRARRRLRRADAARLLPPRQHHHHRDLQRDPWPRSRFPPAHRKGAPRVMIRAVIETLTTKLLRDRSALVLTFVLPIVFFSVFAGIYGKHVEKDVAFYAAGIGVMFLLLHASASGGS